MTKGRKLKQKYQNLIFNSDLNVKHQNGIWIVWYICSIHWNFAFLFKQFGHWMQHFLFTWFLVSTGAQRLVSCWNFRLNLFNYSYDLQNKNHDKAKENRDEEMRLEQIPKFFREKNENLKDSIILRKTRASDESRKESDVSSSLNIKL